MNTNKTKAKMNYEANPDSSCQTYFGYQQVSDTEKTTKVGQVFSSVADRYDLMNDMMSFGVHRLWKRFTVDLCLLRKGYKILDLAGGTGDLSALFAKRVGDQGQVLLSDINAEMLHLGRDRLLNEGLAQRLNYVQANAEQLPFKDDYFDRICIGFGLRNVTHIDRALQSMQRVLKPGGMVVILEFSKPVLPLLNKLYDNYSFHALPKLGQWIADDADSYRYLVESIRMHPDQDKLKSMMETAGFEDCEYFNLTGGIVAVHRGYKY